MASTTGNAPSAPGGTPNGVSACRIFTFVLATFSVVLSSSDKFMATVGPVMNVVAPLVDALIPDTPRATDKDKVAELEKWRDNMIRLLVAPPGGAQPPAPHQGGAHGLHYNPYYAPGATDKDKVAELEKWRDNMIRLLVAPPGGAQPPAPHQGGAHGLHYNQQCVLGAPVHQGGAQPRAPHQEAGNAQHPREHAIQAAGGTVTPVQEGLQWVQGPGGLMASGPTHTSVIKPDGTIAVTSDSLAGAISLSAQAAYAQGRMPLPAWVLEKYMKACNPS